MKWLGVINLVEKFKDFRFTKSPNTNKSIYLLHNNINQVMIVNMR